MHSSHKSLQDINSFQHNTRHHHSHTHHAPADCICGRSRRFSVLRSVCSTHVFTPIETLLRFFSPSLDSTTLYTPSLLPPRAFILSPHALSILPIAAQSSSFSFPVLSQYVNRASQSTALVEIARTSATSVESVRYSVVANTAQSASSGESF